MASINKLADKEFDGRLINKRIAENEIGEIQNQRSESRRSLI